MTPAEAIFDDALAAAQVLEREAIPYFLALIAPACEPIDPRLVASLARALEVDELQPDVAQLWRDAHDTGNPLRARTLAAWLNDEAGMPVTAWDAVGPTESVAECVRGLHNPIINPARTAEQPGKAFHEH